MAPPQVLGALSTLHIGSGGPGHIITFSHASLREAAALSHHLDNSSILLANVSTPVRKQFQNVLNEFKPLFEIGIPLATQPSKAGQQLFDRPELQCGYPAHGLSQAGIKTGFRHVYIARQNVFAHIGVPEKNLNKTKGKPTFSPGWILSPLAAINAVDFKTTGQGFTGFKGSLFGGGSQSSAVSKHRRERL